MAMFVDPNDRVAVSDERGNTIWIKAKMDLATRAALADAIYEMGGREEDDEAEIRMHMGAYRLALLEHNIVGWEGPDFVGPDGKPVPCTRANIRRLDPDEPLVEKAGQVLSGRNLAPAAPDPKSPTDAGSTDAGDS